MHGSLTRLTRLQQPADLLRFQSVTNLLALESKMGGGGPPELFKIVTYSLGEKDARARDSYLSSTVYVQVSEADRLKIAEILGIEPGERARMLAGAVYIYPPASPATKKKKSEKK